MNKIIFLTLFSIAGYLAASAQCDKNFKLKVERVYQVNPDSTEGKTMIGDAHITITKDSIHIMMTWEDGNTAELRGSNTKTVCNMNADYSEGTIDLVYDAVLTARGQSKSDKMFFTVVAKKGEMKVYGAPEAEINDKLCFVIQSKEELK